MQTIKQLSVGKRVLLPFAALGAMLLIIGGWFYFSLRAIERSNQLEQSRALNKLAVIDDIGQDVGQMQALVVREVLASDVNEVKLLDQAVLSLEETNAAEFRDFQQHLDDAEERQLYDAAVRARKLYWEQTQLVMALGRANQDAEAKKLINATQAPAYDQCLEAISKLIAHMEGDANDSAAATTALIAKIGIIGDVLVGLAALVALGAVLAVAGVVRQFKEENRHLQSEVTERKRTEELLRVQTTALDAAANAIVITDHTGAIQSINPAFTALTGYTAEDAVGKTPRFLKSGQQDEAFYRNLWRAISSGQVWSGELTNRRKDGSLYAEGMTITPLRNADGVIARYIAIKQDITERKRAEAGLKLFRALIDQSSDGIYVMDPATRRFLDVNKSGCRALGYTRDELLALTASDVMAEGSHALLDAADARIKEGVHTTAQTLHRRKDGTTYPVEASLSHVKLDRDYLVAISRDITERKRVEDALRDSQQIIEGIINAIPARVFWKDKNLVYLGCNTVFARDAGFADPKDIIGKDDSQMGWRAQAEKYRGDDRQVIESGLSKLLMEEPQTTPQGDIITLLSSKIPLRGSTGEISGVLGTYLDITARKQAEEDLRWKTAFLEAQVNSSIDGILVVDQDRKTSLQNQRFIDLFKIPQHIADEGSDEIRVRWVVDMVKNPESFRQKVLCLYAHPNEISRDEIELIDGTILERYSSPVLGKDGKYYGRIWTFRDITERKRFEARLFQSQKMETVGKLAGGIAHEFNSIMTAIIGQSELMLYDLPAGNPLRKNATEIHQAADRAAVLTRQLLAYGRKQILQPDVLDLDAVLAGMENTLHHLAGRDVDVLIAPSSGPKLVKADPGQIEQVIVNIVMNAADAMPRGGKLTLETAETFLDQEYVSQFHDLKAGDYVMLAITDTGAGMSEAVKARLFEPFFTTKDVGKGSGLGLATCHGIIKQSGGQINVYSEPGRGATFKIYLPKARMEEKPPGPPLQSPGLPRGTETILLVEDDPALREMAAALLGRLGYTVLTAGNGLEALNVTHQRATGHIDLLFTDVVMPHMSGKELSDRIQALYPRTKILFTSAYTETAIVHQGVLNPGITLLQKPFTPSALAGKVREVLDSDKPGAPR